MVTDGDCWPHPSLPIVQQLSQDPVMDSWAPPIIPLSDQQKRAAIYGLPWPQMSVCFLRFEFSGAARWNRLILANLRESELIQFHGTITGLLMRNLRLHFKFNIHSSSASHLH